MKPLANEFDLQYSEFKDSLGDSDLTYFISISDIFIIESLQHFLNKFQKMSNVFVEAW